MAIAKNGSWDDNWDTIHKEKDWGFYPSENLIRVIAQNFYKVRNRKQIKILELGFGTGGQIWFLAREGFDVYGIEGSKVAVEKAKDRLHSENLNAKLEVGDIINLDFPDNYFDCVIDIECYTCIKKYHVKKINENVLRVLKNGGMLFSQTLAEGSYIGDDLVEIEPLTYSESSGGALTRKRLIRLTTQDDIKDIYCGFSECNVEKRVHFYSELKFSTQEWLITCYK